MGHHCKLLEPGCMFYLPIFCKKEINREEEYETNDSFIIISAGCIVYVRTDNFGRVSAENAGQLSVSEAVWSYRKTKEYNLNNALKGYLPQFALSAKASYQSDVTELPVKIPGIDIKGQPKDQYQVMLELKQNIWDGGEIHTKKRWSLHLLMWTGRS